MALMLGNLYRALKDAGADDNAAQKAAEEVVSELTTTQERTDRLNSRVGKVEDDLATLKWMVGTNIALTLLVLGKMFLG